MLPDKPENVKCPACGKRQKRTGLVSGNSVGARHYTDGKVIAPMLPEIPRFVKCPKCGVFYKINERVTRGWARQSAPEVAFLSDRECAEAIDDGLYNAEKHGSKEWREDIILLRLEMWRAFNDRIRDGYEPHGDEMRSDMPCSGVERALYENNCWKLISMLAEYDGDQACLTRAELFRNLGHFDECESELKKVNMQSEYENCIAVMGEACNEKNTLTIQL